MARKRSRKGNGGKRGGANSGGGGGTKRHQSLIGRVARSISTRIKNLVS